MSSISPGKKADFSVIKGVNPEKFVFNICWGKEDTVERVREINQETGEFEFTGEVRETEHCTYEVHRSYEKQITQHYLDGVFKRAQRIPKMRELKEIGEFIGMTEEQMLPWMKGYMLKAIEKHDKSKEVEDFTINGIHMWLDHDLRSKVRENLETAQQKGEENVTLRYEGMAFPMTVTMGWQLYYAVLDYARETWDLREINNAKTTGAGSTDELIAFEDSYKDSYPSRLAF